MKEHGETELDEVLGQVGTYGLRNWSFKAQCTKTTEVVAVVRGLTEYDVA